MCANLDRFRWVACQIDHLSKLPTDAARRRALHELPPDLYTTYDRILEQVNQDSESSCLLVERVLRWLFHCVHPLGNRKLCEAVSIDANTTFLDPEAHPDVEGILMCCSSLVRQASALSGENGLELAHFTVWEYLSSERTRNNPALTRYYCNVTIADNHRAVTCLRYLTLPDVGKEQPETLESYEGFLTRLPFYEYAAGYLDAFIGEDSCEEVFELLKTLFRNSANFALWKRAFMFHNIRFHVESVKPVFDDESEPADETFDWPGLEVVRGSTDSPSDLVKTWSWANTFAANAKPQHFAAILWWDNLLQDLVVQGHDVNEMCRLGSPLHCAIYGVEIVSFAMHSTSIGEWRDKTSKRKKTVETLIELGANVDETFPFKNSCPRFLDSRCGPLCTALSIGDDRLETLISEQCTLYYTATRLKVSS